MRLLVALLLLTQSVLLAGPIYESEPINYYDAPLIDEVAKFFEEGAQGWEYKGQSGFLADFLDTFDISDSGKHE